MASTIGSRLGNCMVGWPASCGAKTVWYFQCGRAKSARPLTIVRPSPIVKTKLLSTGSEPSVTTRSMRAGRRTLRPRHVGHLARGARTLCADRQRAARQVRSGQTASVAVCSSRLLRSGAVAHCRWAAAAPTARARAARPQRPAPASRLDRRVVEAAQRRPSPAAPPPAPGRPRARARSAAPAASSAQACSGAWLAMQHGVALAQHVAQGVQHGAPGGRGRGWRRARRARCRARPAPARAPAARAGARRRSASSKRRPARWPMPTRSSAACTAGVVARVRVAEEAQVTAAPHQHERRGTSKGKVPAPDCGT